MDRVFVGIGSIIIFLIIIAVAIIVVAGLTAIFSDTVHYITHVSTDRELCESLGPQFIFQDDTFFGFGEEGSYGCYIETEDLP